MSYERLIAEHAEIDHRLAQLERLTAVATPDVPAVVLALSALAGELAEHLAHEDAFIYPRMIAGRDADSADVAIKFVSDFATLRLDWGLFLGEWNSECIAGDWDGFRAETASMIARLADRVRAENNLLYAEALRTNAIALRNRKQAA